MLSYRHAFHAGNHADVLKHIIWIEILTYLSKKDKAFYLHDTHAGAGSYTIDSDMMQKKQEYLSGIAGLYDYDGDCEEIRRYVDVIRSFNTAEGLTSYPGSPLISKALMRNQDRMCVTDLHGTDIPLLRRALGHDRRIKVKKMDAYEGLISMSPPHEKRGATLIDPSYEIKKEYATLPQKLGHALTKFPNGVYAIWYPVLRRSDTESFIRQLDAILRSKNQANALSALRVEFNVEPDREDGFGMVGSGMYVINPPYVLEPTMRKVMPVLNQLLAGDKGRVLLEANK
jgi:23S rRNA (adenine2030-N6)-methyltransferase